MIHDLVNLEEASRSLAQANSLDEIKSIRDQAEAARQYAKSAALGLQVQNFAAELRLRAERKAGGLLAQLPLRGGDRKSNSHRESLKLSDIGIDRNKSARWQFAASIPESIFQGYVAGAEASGTEITTQGLFRLASKATIRRGRTAERIPVRKRSNHNRPTFGGAAVGRISRAALAAANGSRAGMARIEIVAEIEHQTQLLAAILTPFCEDRQAQLAVVCKRTVIRLLGEMQELLSQLKTN